MSDRQTLTVVIVSYNVREELAACLASLTTSRRDAYDMTIVVADNGSADGTIEMLRNRWPAVRLIAAGTNLGFARANNLGVAAAPSDLVLLLNPDTVVADDAIATLVRALADHPDAAAVGPRLIDGDGRPELSFGWPVSPVGELRQRSLLRRYAQRDPDAVARVERWTREPGPRPWLSGACLLLRRADFDAVGGFDERFFMYYEDVDLAVRLRLRERTLRFVPAAVVQHLRGRSGRSNPDLARRRRESQVAYYRKHHPAWVPLLRGYLRFRPA